MPTILRIRGFRIGFFQADLVEPIHVHVRKQDADAKYWMSPVALANQRGFRPHELAEIERILSENRHFIESAWKREEEKRGNSTSED